MSEKDARKYVVAYGSLCEQIDRCTCGAGPGGYHGAHEHGCGLEYIASLEQIFAALTAQVARPAPPEPNHGPLPDGGFWAGFCERCDTLGCPGDCRDETPDPKAAGWLPCTCEERADGAVSPTCRRHAGDLS